MTTKSLTARYNELALEHNDLAVLDDPTAGQLQRLDDVKRAMQKNRAEQRGELLAEVRAGRPTVPAEGPGSGWGDSFNVNRADHSLGPDEDRGRSNDRRRAPLRPAPGSCRREGNRTDRNRPGW